MRDIKEAPHKAQVCDFCIYLQASPFVSHLALQHVRALHLQVPQNLPHPAYCYFFLKNKGHVEQQPVSDTLWNHCNAPSLPTFTYLDFYARLSC